MRRLVVGGWLAAHLGCAAGGDIGEGRALASATVGVAAASGAASARPALGPLRPREVEVTDDGIPILAAELAGAPKEGDVVFIRQGIRALDTVVGHEASDGESIYLVVDGADSVLVRDGVVHENVLASHGFDPGGCGAARGGHLLLSGIAATGGSEEVVVVEGNGQRREHRPVKQQVVVLIDAAGKERRLLVPRSHGQSEDCRAWLASDGTFSLALHEIVRFDGRGFAKEAAGWYAGRTVMGASQGAKLCFWSCNGVEAAQTHADTEALLRALGSASGPLPEWIAHDDWVAGVTRGRAVRKRLGAGAMEVVDGVPASGMLNGAHDIAFTAAHDLVIALDYRFRRYVVWPHGKAGLSPERTLGPGERIAHSSPTVLVRGMTTPIPESDTYAVLLGKDIDIGTGGSTVDFADLQRGAAAHRARVDRARKVLPSGQLVATNQAVVERDCGAYVRSPAGWEGEVIHDWSPPQLPALSPKAVFKPTTCLPLEQVSALPGDPDLLLAIHAGELWAAWLPPPLPLPQGTSHWDRKPPAPPPPATPRPGSGWSSIGAVDRLDGDQAIPAPGGNTTIAYGTWQAGGAAIIESAGETIVLTRRGAVTVPAGTRPMAVGQTAQPWLYGALGSKLVACAASCRILDPGPKSDIVAVVPRGVTTLVLGYADGRIGTYRVPASGGQVVPQHALVAKLNAFLATKPQP
jgi:hypothetical protein